MAWGRDYLFKNRHDAGQQLAHALQRYRDAPQTTVLALPRGGVVVAYEICLGLHLPLDVLVTRKLGTPGNPELAMGALAETGYRYMNRDVLDSYNVPHHELEEEIRRQQREIARRIERYRQGRAMPALAGGTVILVDDGIATGATFYASLAALREMKVARLVAAVPVGPDRARDDLRELVEEVVILRTPASFYGIGQFYADFHQIDDEEVLAYLAGVRAALKRTPPPQEPGRSG
jgi:putative phosphoribosyl transferase